MSISISRSELKVYMYVENSKSKESKTNMRVWVGGEGRVVRRIKGKGKSPAASRRCQHRVPTIASRKYVLCTQTGSVRLRRPMQDSNARNGEGWQDGGANAEGVVKGR
jgi:hypothetical protein